MTPRIVLLCASVTLLACGGCHASPPPSAPTVTHAAPEGATTAGVVVDHLQAERHILLNPVDTTRADCPQAGCAQAVTTNRFTVMSFAGTGAAQRYAGDRGLRQIATIVVAFSPTVPEPERDELWADIERTVD
ncbi:hypothetical protein FK535_07640 [Mycolicibacterium sp. 018/SC-01/001]|uniref:hypothetical protein n=1 Tax=Mycolicibacterium sp. 018/SC-01/001 TaxID=2592069 RepID=UPI00117FA14E|nr:hypothetical protein [Mycolicibacterium sp. 018/SC-01/001]TRW86322.1 hypothetical protein FK535_07640 [Mycolicibacterium sp. 018/SC-01/001]